MENYSRSRRFVFRQKFIIKYESSMFASRDVCIHFGKKTWSHLRCYYMYLYKVITRHLKMECFESSMFDYLINQTNPGIYKRTYILKRHFTLYNTGRSAPSLWKSLPLAWVSPTEKHLWNNYQMYEILLWMIDSVHYFSKENNCITVNTILVYIWKRTRLAPKMTTANCHVIC